MKIVILGLSITSSWGNGHATTYRALAKALAERGHSVLFLERDMPWYAAARDLPHPPFGTTRLYGSLDELKNRHGEDLANADLVMVGSYVPEGVEVGRWALATAGGIKAFYDIDTPVTLARLAAGTCQYLAPDLIPRYDLYLSFTGGPVLERIERHYGAPRAVPLYCSVDPELYYPEPREPEFDLGYMGTYCDDRQPTVESLLVEPARRWDRGAFVVAGVRYPADIEWPLNVLHVEHLPPDAHRRFYTAQRFTLNVTRRDMIRAGHSPSVRLFEAAACGTPIISDDWNGLDAFFRIGEEILVAENADDVLHYLHDLSESERRAIGGKARTRVLAAHTAGQRAVELENYLNLALADRASGRTER
jgi:spore maturation protein CgeB